MPISLIILSNLGLTMALFGLALAIAWARFGRDAHVAVWSAAFVVAALGDAVYLVTIGHDAIEHVGAMVATNASLVCAALFSHGFRRRVGLDAWGRLAALTGAVIVAGTVAMLRWPDDGRSYAIAHAGDSVLFLLSAQTLRRGSWARGGASRATLWMLAGFSAYIGALPLLAPLARPDGPLPEVVYAFAMLVGVPVGMIGLGLFAMLLVGSDLSDRLQRLASIDPLTEVSNRRGFDAAGARMVAQCRRAGRPLTLVLADLDRFKSINDRFGHAIGDLVLRRFAAHCAATIRDGDLVGRIGGEEFVLLLADAGPGAATDAMERLRAGLPAALADLALPVAVTASFGIAALEPDDADLKALMIRADAALYGSKDGGRDRITQAVSDRAAPAADPRFLAAFSRHAATRAQAPAEPTAPPAYGRRN